MSSRCDRDIAVGSNFEIVEQRFEADAHLLERAFAIRFQIVPEARPVQPVRFRMSAAETDSDIGSVSTLL